MRLLRRWMRPLGLAAVALALCCNRSQSEQTSTVSSARAESPRAAPRTVAAAAPPAGRRVITIGWDGADWELLDSLRAQGRLPNLDRFVSQGRSATLHSFQTSISPMVWTTIATGAQPDEHGVLDFFEIDPGSGRSVPVTSRSVRVPAWWELASACGRTVGVVNYWATFPAEELAGFMISDRVSPTLSEPDPAQLSSAFFPPAEGGRLREVIASVGASRAQDLRRFGDFPDSELGGRRGQMLAQLVRSTSSVEALAEDFYDRHTPQSMVLYFLGTDETAHLFGQETPPRLPCVTPESFARFSEVVPRFYAWMDEFLGRWMARAQRDNAVVLLVSDHGFLWGSRRSCLVNPLQRRSASTSHRPLGIAAAWGQDVVAAPERSSASVFDVAPTLAALLDLPVDRKASGHAWTEWFRGVPPPSRGDVWASFSRPRRLPFVPPKSDEYASRLRSLGYLAGGSSPAASAAAAKGDAPGRTATGWLNLGNYWSEQGKKNEAVSAFRQALAVSPGFAPAQVDLVSSLLAVGRKREAVAAAQKAFEASEEDRPWTIYEIAARLEASGLIEEEERFLREAIQRLPSSEPVVVSLAGLSVNRGRCREAFDLIRPFLNDRARADDWNVAGLSLRCLGREAEARQMFERSLAVDPNQPSIRAMLSRQPARRGSS